MDYDAIYECGLAALSVMCEVGRVPCPTCGQADPELADEDEIECWRALAEVLYEEAHRVCDAEHGR